MIRSDSTVPEGDIVVQASVPLTAFEVVYSTADVERHVFYGERHVLPIHDEPADVSMAVVNGEIFRLDQESAPPGLVPLPEDSRLLRLARERSNS